MTLPKKRGRRTGQRGGECEGFRAESYGSGKGGGNGAEEGVKIGRVGTSYIGKVIYGSVRAQLVR